ncbi:dehydrodolichyl diphosphate synthase complex subunit Dhdds-like [Pectinophora gossypiella]|uniref:dehydrodolichyl diphosphate synthase complex subunit Dhdds-like n=1 Tax=Pectinophora gossypiella TaxID=13191 RepID=UPI00214E7462|nr:dehydrodolichyl diphosphate synthase complex subunit Dhdds-like [Pectinophora gossypiella]
MLIWLKERFILFCIKVINIGRVPAHIGFIMDGNRRFAKKYNLGLNVSHYKGFDIFWETVQWCRRLEIPEVTVYAFSIENFNRTKDEVENLIDLARVKFQGFLDNIDRINQLGIRIFVAGRLSLLPEDLRAKMAEVMLLTQNNNKVRLNIACSYTARDEISRAASHLVDGVKNEELLPEDIDEELISRTLELGEPELLVRTSGEVRLSDFMLWQVSNTVLYFTDVLWPEFSIWNILAAIIHFQRHAPPARLEKRMSKKNQNFLDRLAKLKRQKLDSFL